MLEVTIWAFSWNIQNPTFHRFLCTFDETKSMLIPNLHINPQTCWLGRHPAPRRLCYAKWIWLLAVTSKRPLLVIGYWLKKKEIIDPSRIGTLVGTSLPCTRGQSKEWVREGEPVRLCDNLNIQLWEVGEKRRLNGTSKVSTHGHFDL